MTWIHAVSASVLLAAVLAACSPQRQPQPETGIGETEGAVIEEPRPAEPGAVEPRPDAGSPAVPPGRPVGEGASPRPAPSPPAPAVESVTGRVAVTGSEPFPFTTLIVEGGPSYRLTGELEPELRNLSGAVVRVEGTSAAGAPSGGLMGQPLEVRRYEIVSIDGQRPQVGTLVRRDGAWWLDGAERTRLAAVPEALQAQEGARVWIVGPRADGALHIQSYGIIRTR